MQTASFLAGFATTCCLLQAVAKGEQTPLTPRDRLVEARIQENLSRIQAQPWPSPQQSVKHADYLALLLLFKNEDIEEANRLVKVFCDSSRVHQYVQNMVPNDRSEALFRIYLTEPTRKRLSPEARGAIEDYAWDLLTKYNLGISRSIADQATLTNFLLPNNGQTNKWRRYTLALHVVRKADRYGPDSTLEGDTIDSHCGAWDRFWIRFFQTFPKEGTDMDVAHPSFYSTITIGVYYDLYDLMDDPEVRRLAGNFLTLYWAEVASEFQPTTGERGGMATTRWPWCKWRGSFWARDLLYCYGWHDNSLSDNYVGNVPFLTSAYRPPAIVTAIASTRDRGSYLATSRRPGLTGGEGVEVSFVHDPLKHAKIVVDGNGDSHFRRDVYYTPDYALGTLTTDPQRHYISDVVLTPMMGATFASSPKDRVTVTGAGYYPMRATSGITGTAVSIIARDPNAEFGQGRFKSDGTTVFVSNGSLWENRVVDQSGWFFSRAGDAYVAIRAGQGYQVTTETQVFHNRESVDRKVVTVQEADGHYLRLNDLWEPIVIQMGRAVDYEGFTDFCAAVRDNQWEYGDGKLVYVSEAGDTYEVWAKGVQSPRINGRAINLNPPKTFDSPFLSMTHGSATAVIRFPGWDDEAIDFSPGMHAK